MTSVTSDQQKSGVEATQQVSNTIWSKSGKRLFDVVVSGLLLVFLSPFLILISLLIRLTSPGPVFFMQKRAGKDCVVFMPYKFRTMRGDRKPDRKELVPLEHADITSIGWLLRRFKMDELPQLINVFTGEMSLVGPRPTLPDQVEAYDDFRRQRMLIRPGITGLAQVYSSATSSWEERILYDIAYVRRCSFLMDVGIFLRTILTILFGESSTVKPFGTTRFSKHVTPPDGYGGIN